MNEPLYKRLKKLESQIHDRASSYGTITFASGRQEGIHYLEFIQRWNELRLVREQIASIDWSDYDDKTHGTLPLILASTLTKYKT